EGDYASGEVQVRQTDVAGNQTIASDLGAVTIDTTGPALSLSLAEDTGDDSDGITSNGRINVSGLESGQAWQYQTESSGSWFDGSGSSFSLNEGDYASGEVQVRQTDAAGNEGTASNLGNVTIEPSGPVVVMFDLINGTTSSDGGERTFSTGKSYEIYILIDSNSVSLNTIASEQRWGGNLSIGSDDKVTLISNSSEGARSVLTTTANSGIRVDTFSSTVFSSNSGRYAWSRAVYASATLTTTLTTSDSSAPSASWTLRSTISALYSGRTFGGLTTTYSTTGTFTTIFSTLFATYLWSKTTTASTSWYRSTVPVFYLSSSLLAATRFSLSLSATGSSTYVKLSSTTNSSQLTSAIHSAVVTKVSAARIGYFAQLPTSIASWDGAVLTLA
ncbi:MAG: hypothetical protein ACN4EJ_03760, partial [Porticoccaceae bacterium]